MDSFARFQARLDRNNGHTRHSDPGNEPQDGDDEHQQRTLSSTPRRLFGNSATPLEIPQVVFGFRSDQVVLTRDDYTEKRTRIWVQIIESQLEAYLHHVWLREKNLETREYETRYFWMFISSGLDRILGAELVFIVSRREEQDPTDWPTDPIFLFHELYQRAQRIEPLTLILLQEPVLGRQDFRTLYFGLSNFPLRSVGLLNLPRDGFGFVDSELPPRTLQVIALTDTEVEIAIQYGLTRVLARLGFLAARVPYPPYIDLERKSCFKLKDMEGSLPAAHPALRDPRLMAMSSESQVTLVVPQSEVETFRAEMRQLPLGGIQPLAIYSLIHDDCDSVFLWRMNGGRINIHHAKQGERLTAISFVILCPGHEKNRIRQSSDGYLGEYRNLTNIRLLQSDGYLVLFTPNSWTQFLSAIHNESPFTLTAEDEEALKFHLAWPPHPPSQGAINSANPFIAYGGVHRRKPNPRYHAAHVDMGRIAMLIEPREEDANLDLMDDYVAQLQSIMAKTLPKERPRALRPGGCLIVVQICLPPPPGEDWRAIAVLPPEAPGVLPLGELYQLISRDRVPRNVVLNGEWEFQLYFECWGFKLTDGM
jgi:hypothetical protein